MVEVLLRAWLARLPPLAKLVFGEPCIENASTEARPSPSADFVPAANVSMHGGRTRRGANWGQLMFKLKFALAAALALGACATVQTAPAPVSTAAVATQPTHPTTPERNPAV